MLFGAALLAVAPGSTVALTDLGGLSAALPPAVASDMGFAGNAAPGWKFAQPSFVEAGYRDADPGTPSLHGYDARFTAPPLAIGTLAEVVAVPPRRPSLDEVVAALDSGQDGLDAAALRIFDRSSAQVFGNYSLTIGGGEFGQSHTFKFAGQVGSSNDN